MYMANPKTLVDTWHTPLQTSGPKLYQLLQLKIPRADLMGENPDSLTMP